MSDDTKKGQPCDGKDVVTLGPEIAPGVHPAVRHDANHEITVGMLHIVKEGQPMPDNTLVLQKGEGSEFHVVGEVSKVGRSGPAQVATDAYRRNYETIFGARQVVGEA